MKLLFLTIVLSILLVFGNGQSLETGRQNSPNLIHSQQQQQTENFQEEPDINFRGTSYNEFDWKLVKNVLLNERGNTILSPFSVKILLALLYEAAGQDSLTQRELRQVFTHLADNITVAEKFAPLIADYVKPNSQYDLLLGTGVFLDHRIRTEQKFGAIAQSKYRANVISSDFDDYSGTTHYINEWCSNVTRGNIKSIVKESDVQKAVMILVNGFYFKGLWKYQFLPELSINIPFFVTPTTKVDTQFMRLTGKFYYHESREGGFKILGLPYNGNKFVMKIVLPTAKAGLDEFLTNLLPRNFDRNTWLMDPKEVMVLLPKCKFDTTTNLVNYLKDMGIREIFSTEASLPGLARGTGLQNQLQVSNILQKAGLTISEKGTEVYAATEVSLTNKFGGNQNEEKDFICNRPFMIYIEDYTTGTILAAGKITDPTTFAYNGN